MILILAVLIGLLAGIIRAYIRKFHFSQPQINLLWLVPVAFLPQLLSFYLPATRNRIPDVLASFSLISSQLLLLLFAWVNRKQPGFLYLGVGLCLNLTVIALNGGFMPIRPEAVLRIYPEIPKSVWQIGERLGFGKDIVIPLAETKLWWFSDYFTTPKLFPYKIAFSLGDILLAIGAFWFFWSLGNKPKQNINYERLKVINHAHDDIAI